MLRRSNDPRGASAAYPRNAAVVAFVVAVASLGAIACRRGDAPASSDSVASAARPTAVAAGATLDIEAPADSLIPADEMGVSIRRGQALVLHTTDSLPDFAPGNITCANCHLDGGRRRHAASLVGVHARYPRYMDRSGAVVPIEDRVNYCFTRSLAGRRLPSDSREMQDIVAYLAFLSRGVPVGAHVTGEGMPKMPALTGDTTRGAALFAGTCASCHGPSGQGRPPAIPALWGAGSYSIGASMAREERAASFIRHFMPLDKPGTLTDQQAYDVAAYINAQPRPDSPGKERDWPDGGAARDVPYATSGHAAYRPPVKLIARGHPVESIVPVPRSVRGASSGTPR